MEDTTHRRLLIADDQVEIRSAMRLLLDYTLGVTTVDEAADASALIRLAVDGRPGLVLLDWELPGQPGDSLVRALQAARADMPIVVLSSKPEVRAAALEAGAVAFVSKGDPPEVLVQTITDHMPQSSPLPAIALPPTHSDRESVDLVAFVDAGPHALRQDRRLRVVR
jgi:DNA-binding NarL/FixJ family response regulator